jgi:hypothetical protein
MKEILQVNMPKGFDNTCRYKRAKLGFLEDEEVHLSRRLRKKVKKMSREFTGKKFVNQDVKFLFNFKKQYSNEKDLEDDLYKIYANWHQSKVNSHGKYMNMHNVLAGTLGYNIMSDKAKRRYTLTQDLFMKYVKHEQKCPKRFLNIVKFCSSLRERKAIRNNGHVDKMVELVSVISSKENSGVVVPVHESSRVRCNQRMLVWLSSLIADVVRRGYLNLTRTMIHVGELPILHNWSPENWESFSSEVGSSWHFKMLDRRSRKVSSSLAGHIVRKISESYLGEDEGYNVYMKEKKREINMAFRKVEQVAAAIKKSDQFEELVKLARGDGVINPSLHIFRNIDKLFPNSKLNYKDPFKNANSRKILTTFIKSLHKYLDRSDMKVLNPSCYEIRPLAVYAPLAKIISKDKIMFISNDKIPFDEDDVRIYDKLVKAILEVRTIADARVSDVTHPAAREGIFKKTVFKEIQNWFGYTSQITKGIAEDMWLKKVQHEIIS